MTFSFKYTIYLDFFLVLGQVQIFSTLDSNIPSEFCEIHVRLKESANFHSSIFMGRGERNSEIRRLSLGDVRSVITNVEICIS